MNEKTSVFYGDPGTLVKLGEEGFKPEKRTRIDESKLNVQVFPRSDGGFMIKFKAEVNTDPCHGVGLRDLEGFKDKPGGVVQAIAEIVELINIRDREKPIEGSALQVVVWQRG